MSKRLYVLIVVLFVGGLLIALFRPGGESLMQELPPPGAPVALLTAAETALLEEMLATHLNLYLSADLITQTGLPLTAYKSGDRARYGWSNPTEWGYAIQVWIAAAERGLISEAEAISRISAAVATMRALQQDPAQSLNGLFYPFYTLTGPDGNDLPAPIHDANHNIPSGDLALLYLSLTVAHGWAIEVGDAALQAQLVAVRDVMNFRPFLVQEDGQLYLAHLINADTGARSPSRWDIFSDEGGLVTWAFYLSGSGSFEEFQQLTNAQRREPAAWKLAF